MRPVFQLEKANASYERQGKMFPVFLDLDLALDHGQQLGLFGPNGCGKTTFFRCITGLKRLDSGRISFLGQECAREADFVRLRQKVGFALQQADDQIFFPTVLEDVCFGPLNLGLTRKEAEERAWQTLADLDLEDLAPRLVDQLSTGEKRLVALAGIMAMHPLALLLDEPTSGLDPAATARLTSVLQTMPCARITVSHDFDFLKAVSQSLLTIRDNRILTVE